MPEAIPTLAVYLHLARASGQRRQPLAKDKLLILAGVAAAESGLDEVGAYCRRIVLEHNPQHLVGQWPTIEEAMSDASFQAYLKQLRRQYSTERAEHLLASLGIQVADERRSYFSDHEYAAALLGHTPDSIAAALSRPASAVVAPSPPNGPRLAASGAKSAWELAALLGGAVLAGIALWWWRGR